MTIEDNFKTLFSSESRQFSISEDTRNEIERTLRQARRDIMKREAEAIKTATNFILTD